MVEVFNEVKRVLKSSGTLWLNIGDSYAGSMKGQNADGSPGKCGPKDETAKGRRTGGLQKSIAPGLKPKDLIGIPWMLAFALRGSGWWLRQEIIWNKPSLMPESVKDRCTKSHEQIFLLSKSQKYFFDYISIQEPVAWSTTNDSRLQDPSYKAPIIHRGLPNNQDQKGNGLLRSSINQTHRNKRTVWTVSSSQFPEAHFATFPPELIVDCIKAGCPENGIVLDPFNGSGTTRIVAEKLGRNSIGIELNPKYIQIENRRRKKELGMFEKIAS